MPLLDLPTELLRQIVGDSMPLGFENLMLTCRAVSECGSPLIELHNSLKRDWSNLEWTSFERALPLIKDLMEEPLRSAYVRTADFKGDDSPRLSLRRAQYMQTPQFVATETLRQDSATMKKLGAFMARNPYLQAVGTNVDGWIEEIVRCHDNLGDDPPTSIYILLLTMFHNITKLTLPIGWDGDIMSPEAQGGPWVVPTAQQMWSVIEMIQEQHKAGDLTAPLSKLERLEIFKPQTYDDYVHVEYLTLFLTMPKLREVYATSINFADEIYHRPDLQLPPLGPVLSKLELSHSCIDAFGIGRLVSQMPSLTSFKYEHACKHHGTLFAWDAGEFVAALGEHAGDRLEEVSITLENSKLAAISRGVTGMSEFTRLKRFEVDMRVFLGPSLESGENLDLGDKPKEGYEKWTANAIPPLTKILPSSLERLDMFVWTAPHLHPSSRNDDFDTVPLEKLYKDFGESRGSDLPALVSCKLRSSGDRPQTSSTEPTVWDYIESQGVECEMGKKMPWWQERFQETFGPLGRNRW